MNATRLIGAVILAVGIVLLIFAYNASEAPVDQITNALTGRYSDRTMWYLILGVIGVVAGGILSLRSDR